ncbi:MULTISPECIES: hypothetical protein [unclassified Streptomyces]|uniref:hypothetical protein n=1 Tax=unclassified Streptomyces TaxID=2593676 RepID=UPI0009693F7D|nr:hypothetical protein [Streptomyces sp. CB02261]OKJ52545.1 hypothetical protein AMK29_30410 [Streptomyces sp. CB02261]
MERVYLNDCSGECRIHVESDEAEIAALRAELGTQTSGSVRQLVEIHAQDRWRAITGARLVALLRSHARVENGVLAEREEAMAT